MNIFSVTFYGITIAPTYYGLMYAISFIIGYFILEKRKIIGKKYLEDLFLYIFLGVVLGGRIGYIFFYNLGNYLSNPVDIIKFWEGGMSFHGGVIGVILAMYFFSKKYKQSFLMIADQITLVLPIGLGFGRIGNYLNKELLGYSDYNGLFAVYKDGIGYFPSPLLESFLEGLLLFLFLNYFYLKGNLKRGQIASLFLILYSIFRLLVEIFFREPDSQIGYILGYFTMGEILSLPMFIIGIILFLRFKNEK
ncbi:MAG: prolipoprotein diacylglyceryl transferase [Candidatus Gracilibacteria bacterium]|nr:prolipoprotein diacylglyceryl transferase [Candidatus Gracilibacteria bacterium]